MRKNKVVSVKFLKNRVTESEPFYISGTMGVFVAKRILKDEVNNIE